MADDEPSEPTGADPDIPPEDAAGVFGNLPKTRPGARSPRRDAGPRARAAPTRAASEEPPAPAPKPPPAPRQAPGAEGGGLEDVAWAGIAAAAEAATIGVRLTTRALEAMRDAVDRR